MKLHNIICGWTVAVAAVVAPGAVGAATLSAVPMQGGMVMPMVQYTEATGALSVMVDPTVPQLTPLLVSNPADGFDPADPWYDVLDPSRQGLAFSRRYGFVMDAASDPLPAGRQIWLRKLSSSPGIRIYRYASTAPKAFEPIFGTDGATNAMYWNGMMFHPTVAAPAGTNTYAASFEAYLVDTTTGLEVAGSKSMPFGFTWTEVPDGRPALNLAPRMVVFCPADATNWVLEATESLESGNWTTITNASISLEGGAAVVMPANETRTFFRMRMVR
jgi:hypothetical protein